MTLRAERLFTIVGTVVLAAAICAHWVFGVDAMVRVMGIGFVLAGLHALVTREVPVGIEGRRPSFHIRGLPAVIVGTLMLGVAVYLLLFAPVATCTLGWSSKC